MIALLWMGVAELRHILVALALGSIFALLFAVSLIMGIVTGLYVFLGEVVPKWFADAALQDE